MTGINQFPAWIDSASGFNPKINERGLHGIGTNNQLPKPNPSIDFPSKLPFPFSKVTKRGGIRIGVGKFFPGMWSGKI